MENADALYLFAEIAAVLAGFVSLTTAYQGGYTGRFAGNLRIGQRYILMTAAVMLFAALLPIVLHGLGLTAPLLWQVSAAFAGLSVAAARIDAFRIMRVLPAEARARISSSVMWLTALVTTIQALIAALVLGGPLLLPELNLPLAGLYILFLYLGLVSTISIFAANLMVSRDFLLRQIERDKAEESDDG